ncbi:eukaryotic translation initiation factor 4 gamma 2-like isoform X1 [Artemia franciscana]|uniref:eukaryotic translation initiation factor 4 gamma 2-like isoform X1 n=2 Tax=Artemia franciscana TaxID=6661 RepID=UPI0032DBA74A
MVCSFNRISTDKVDEQRSLSTSSSVPNRRWIPPSVIKRDALHHDDKRDLTFRKVRGILNKLTPERFEKLSEDLLSLGLNSEVILKGVILLIFDKALDEPKYSSMYARLCKKLQERAPNFETPNSPSTFCKLLLNCCRAEFENRTKASDYYEKQNGVLTADEEEERAVAKRKMLGNIKFMGELGKLEMLQSCILHKCIQQLLEKRSRGGLREMAENLECLTQIIMTCGRILDTDKAKSLMDQYFDRMSQLSVNEALPSRIRFMLQNAIDLRRNGWVPRILANAEGPKTIQQIREDAARDIGVFIPPNTGGRGPPPMVPIMEPNYDLFPRKGFSDVFGGMPLGLGMGPGTINGDDFGISNGYHFDNRQGHRPRNSYSMQPNQNHFVGRGGGHRYQRNPLGTGYEPSAPYSAQNQNSSTNGKDLPPRFQKMSLAPRGGSPQEEILLKPPPMTLRPKVGMLPPSAILNSQNNATLELPNGPGFHKSLAPLNSIQKDPPIIIKQASSEKKSNKKGPSKEEIHKKVDHFFQAAIALKDMDEVVLLWRDMKIPERFATNSIAHMMISALHKSNSERDAVSKIILKLKRDAIIGPNHLFESYKEILTSLSLLEVEVPRVKSYVAGYIARSVNDEILTLSEVATPLEAGAHFPLFLLTLQQLSKIMDKDKLYQLFINSKISLLSMLPEIDRTGEKLAELLDDRGLSFLFPLMRIQTDLWKQIQVESSPQLFYKWIKDNVDAGQHSSPGFISSLMTVIVKYITQESGSAECGEAGNDKMKGVFEKEKELLEKYRPVLGSFLNDQVQLEITALYALQSFIHGLQFPKGMLLRWFRNLYDMEIIEEEAFLKWKEDLKTDVPGKGKALFQVNSWLTWLETADSEEEEEA